MVHRLQEAFATLEGERDYTQGLAAWIAAGDLDRAEEVLAAALATLDTDLARLCLATPRAAVEISGWAELVDAVDMHEGAPITALTIGLANELDVAFEKEIPHAPVLLHGLYTDEAFAFSSTSPAELRALCAADEAPWAEREEDIELYLEIDGLTAINTALLRHKRRYFIREDAGGAPAPRAYVEAVLAAWLRALRFHQAVATEVAVQGLPGRVAVISGTVDMGTEAAMVHLAKGALTDDTFGSLAAVSLQRKVPLPAYDPNATGSAIRRKVVAAETEHAEASPPPRKPGFFARLFGRR